MEGTGPDAYRWTEAECTLFLTLEGRALCFEMAADRPPGWAPVEVRVSSVDRELGAVELTPGSEWQQVVIPLPGDLATGPAHIRVAVRETWQPCSTGHGGDNRDLGVRIRPVWCEG